MKLTELQYEAFERVKDFMKSDASIFILNGCAGTGKTTMVKHIVDYISQKSNVVLMSPTGRAARVLRKKTGYEAFTIHKGIYDFEKIVAKEVKDIAESKFKLIFPLRHISNDNIVAIVDEASMLSSQTVKNQLFQFGTGNLMDDLLTFVRPSFGGKLIFVGDPAQLPPVGENVSQALNGDFFTSKGLKVVQTELTEVLRQKNDGVILKNAMQIRDLLNSDKRNHMVFNEKKNEVESIPSHQLLDLYIHHRKLSGKNDSVLICFSNRSASEYNKSIRSRLFGENNRDLQVGEVLMVVKNNYHLNRMNGEFVPVLWVGQKIEQWAPVYVQEGAQRVRKNITLEFQKIQVVDSNGEPQYCMVLLDLLYNGVSSLSVDEQRALFINFCMRYPYLKQGTEEFSNAIKKDEYYNCLNAKFGYAVTGHKCQGGEWSKVFVDYSGRTGMSDDCLKWAYTATTRAQKTLYFTNLPHITPFSKFKIEQIQKCTKVSEDYRIIAKVDNSPFHKYSDENYLHAKCLCIIENMEFTPFKVNSVVSKPYLEIYYIQTPDGIERYDIKYKKGGLFSQAISYQPSIHSVLIRMMLDNENAIPTIFDYTPSDEIYQQLYNFIRSICDDLNIPITNVIENKERYNVVYYFRTMNTISYIKVYINASGFITYAQPMSLLGNEDNELKIMIEKIQNNFE